MLVICLLWWWFSSGPSPVDFTAFNVWDVCCGFFFFFLNRELFLSYLVSSLLLVLRYRTNNFSWKLRGITTNFVHMGEGILLCHPYLEFTACFQYASENSIRTVMIWIMME